MMRNLSCLVAVLCAVFQLTGCVSSETYRVKEQEAARLGKSLEEQQGEAKKLAARNEQCQGEVQRLSGDLKTVQGERDALATSKKGLEESLRSTADSKNARIAELSQTLGEQQTENKRLKDELVRQQKLKELEVQKTSKTYEDLLDKMKGEISKGEITISELKGKLTVNVVESVLFDSGRAEVKPEGKAVLFKVVDILKTLKDKAIRVEGHTDNVQIGGELARRYPTNWELSAARAINVTRYLQQNGIDPHLLAAVGFGEYHPVASNDTPEDRAKNRRIEITLVSNE